VVTYFPQANIAEESFEATNVPDLRQAKHKLKTSMEKSQRQVAIPTERAAHPFSAKTCKKTRICTTNSKGKHLFFP
jgi:hypothetical protein